MRPHTSPPVGFRTRASFYSPKVEREVLLALDFMTRQDEQIAILFRLEFAATMVDYSNYSYEPSLGMKKSVGRQHVDDYPGMDTLMTKFEQIAYDIEWYKRNRANSERQSGEIFENSFLQSYNKIDRQSVDSLVTSPLYLNNCHYNRNTRPHLYWLGFCQ